MRTISKALNRLAVSAVALTAANAALAAEPITVLINNSPWYGGFEALVEAYEEETGNTVEIDRTPYPGLLEKVRNAVRGDESPYDLVNMNAPWVVEFYGGGFIKPLTDIDPDFTMPPEIITNGGAIYWNEEKQWPTPEGGKLMAFSPNSNAHVWYYRNDRMDGPPDTYDDVMAACAANHNPPDQYGAVLRGERGNPIAFAYQAHMLAHGGNFVRDAVNGDYTVVFNSPENLEALNKYLEIQNNCSTANPGSVGQGELIQLVLSGKATQAAIVVAAVAQMDNPEKSAVVGKIDFAPMPRPIGGERGAIFGTWQMAVPNNIPDARAEAAMEFIKYFLTEDAQEIYARGGGIPVHMGVLRGPLSEEERFRWMQPYATVAESAQAVLFFTEGNQMEEIAGLRLNQALIGELTPEEALNMAAQDMYDVLSAAGRETGMLPPL